MSKMEFDENGVPSNLGLAGKVRKSRIQELADAGMNVSDEMRTGWDLVRIPQDEFELMVDKEREITESLSEQESQSPKPVKAKELSPEDQEKRIKELEEKLAKLSEAPQVTQETLDSIVEKKLLEMGLHGKTRDTETDLKLFKAVTDQLSEFSRQNQQSQGYQSARPVARAQVDVEDVLDEPVHFFAYNSQYAIFGDKRMGQEIHTPYGTPIKFKRSIRMVRNPGSSRYDKSILSVCEAKIHSKKEMEFLKTHSLFGVKFFETANEAASVSVELAEVMGSVANEVAGLTQHQVVSRAKTMNLPMDQSVDVVKRALIDAIAKQRMEKLGKANPARMTQSMRMVDLNNPDSGAESPLPADFMGR
jgi:hypothetical protein